MDTSLNSLLLLLILLTANHCKEVSSQDLHQVQAEQIPPVLAGGTARFRCSFVGDNITVQYVSWTKFEGNGRRTFVYEYSQHPPLARAYHDFIGRATITNADMNDKRYSYLRSIPKAAAVEVESKMNNARRNLPQKKSADQWSKMHESIYGIFSDSMQKGHKTPNFKAIEDIFKGMDDKHDMVGRLKRLEIPVTKDDIQKVLFPMNMEQPFSVPMRLSDEEGSEVSGEVYRRRFWKSPQKHRSKRRAVPVHHIDLQLVHVLLSDEATYECLVKPINGPAVSSSMRLFVQVPPTHPVLSDSGGPYADGSNLTLTCKSNLGKPAGTIKWARRKVEDTSFHEVPEEEYETEAWLEMNSTTSVVSRLQLQLSASDDGSTYRCVTESAEGSNGRSPNELSLFSQKTIAVFYPPRGGRILFDTAVGRYYCHSRGKPAPSYSWVWLRADGRQTVMSTNRYLDLSGMRRSGYYRFHCLASNNIDGIKHTKVMATKLRVIAPDQPTTSDSLADVTRSWWRRSTAKTDPTTTTTTTPQPTTTTTIPTTTTTTQPTTTTTLPTTTMTPTTTEPKVVEAKMYTLAPVVYPDGFPEAASRQLIPTFDVTGQRSEEKNSANEWKNVKSQKQKKDKPDDDYYYYYFYDTGKKQPAHEYNRPRQSWSSPNKKNTGPMQQHHFIPSPNTPAPPTQATQYYAYPEEKSFKWEDLKSTDGQTFTAEDLPDIQEDLKTDLKQPVPYNPFASTMQEESRLQDSLIQADLFGNFETSSDNDNTFYDVKETGGVEVKPKEVEKEDVRTPKDNNGYRKRSRKQKSRRRKYKRNYYDDDDSSEDDDDESYDNYKHNKKSSRHWYRSRYETEYEDEEKSNQYEKVTVTSSEEFDCGERRSGVHRAGCRAFYRCIDGKTYAVECRQPFVYNKLTQECGEPTEAPAPCGKFRDCSDKPSRKYVDEERGCKYYYTCYRGFFMGHNECNPGLIFNENSQLCDWPNNVDDQACEQKPKKKKKKRSSKRSRRYRN